MGAEARRLAKPGAIRCAERADGGSGRRTRRALGHSGAADPVRAAGLELQEAQGLRDTLGLSPNAEGAQPFSQDLRGRIDALAPRPQGGPKPQTPQEVAHEKL